MTALIVEADLEPGTRRALTARFPNGYIGYGFPWTHDNPQEGVWIAEDDVFMNFKDETRSVFIGGNVRTFDALLGGFRKLMRRAGYPVDIHVGDVRCSGYVDFDGAVRMDGMVEAGFVRSAHPRRWVDDDDALFSSVGVNHITFCNVSNSKLRTYAERIENAIYSPLPPPQPTLTERLVLFFS